MGIASNRKILLPQLQCRDIEIYYSHNLALFYLNTSSLFSMSTILQILLKLRVEFRSLEDVIIGFIFPNMYKSGVKVPFGTMDLMVSGIIFKIAGSSSIDERIMLD